MATTAEPQHDFGNHGQADAGQRLGHRRARPAAPADGVRAPRASARRRRHQDHLRRDLPQRPAHLPERLGRHALPGHPRPRDRRHRHRDRQRGHPPPRRRHGRGRLHGRQLHGVRPVPRRLGSVLPQGLRPDLQQRRLSRRHDQQGRLHRPYRRPRPFRASRCPKAWTSAGSRLCCAPGSRPIRRCANTMSDRTRRWRSSASAGSATWA